MASCYSIPQAAEWSSRGRDLGDELGRGRGGGRRERGSC